MVKDKCDQLCGTSKASAPTRGSSAMGVSKAQEVNNAKNNNNGNSPDGNNSGGNSRAAHIRAIENTINGKQANWLNPPSVKPLKTPHFYYMISAIEQGHVKQYINKEDEVEKENLADPAQGKSGPSLLFDRALDYVDKIDKWGFFKKPITKNKK